MTDTIPTLSETRTPALAGKSTGFSIDPIERKSLNHLLPGLG